MRKNVSKIFAGLLEDEGVSSQLKWNTLLSSVFLNTPSRSRRTLVEMYVDAVDDFMGQSN